MCFFFLLIPSWKIFNNMFPTINKNSKQLTSRGWLVWLKWQWKEQSSKEKVVMFSKFQKACWNTYDKTLLYFIFHPLLSPVGLSDDVYVLFQLYCLQLPYFWFHFATPQCPENKFQVTCTSVEEGSAYFSQQAISTWLHPPECRGMALQPPLDTTPDIAALAGAGLLRCWGPNQMCHELTAPAPAALDPRWLPQGGAGTPHTLLALSRPPCAVPWSRGKGVGQGAGPLGPLTILSKF